MPNILYLDFNRGSDANSGLTAALPKKNFSNLFNFDPGGGGGGVYLASDSVWDLSMTRAASGVSTQTRFNGASGNPAFLTSYVPSGGDAATKPTIQQRLIPAPSDWLWDATLNFGVPKGWYIQLDWNIGIWDAWIKCGGRYAITTNQSTTNNTGLGYINGEQVASASAGVGDFVNGMGYETLRFNVDYGGLVVAGNSHSRIYLSGAGLLTPGAGNDPSSVYGPGQIVIGCNSVFSFYGCGNYVDISNIRCQNGNGLILLQAPDNSTIDGFKMHDCEFDETNLAVRINTGSGTTAGTRWDVDIHDNESAMTSGPFMMGYGPGVTGYFRHNVMVDGNNCSSIAGGIYTQLQPSTKNGYAEPFQVQHNTAQRWLNGTGNCTFDGTCYYADIYDSGTEFKYNLSLDSYFPWQIESGGKAVWHANVAINCEAAGVYTNAPITTATDYEFTHNLNIAAKRGTFFCGQGANTHKYGLVLYQSGSEAAFVRALVANNILVNHPQGNPEEIPVLAYSASLWATGKVTVKNNAFVGYNQTRQVVADFNAVDKTSSCASVNAALADFVDAARGDYRPIMFGALQQAGYTYNTAAALDRVGNQYYATREIGPYSALRRADWFGRGYAPA